MWGWATFRLGQSATTLSGGEAQRIKFGQELSRKATGRTLYILDEPTTGYTLPTLTDLAGAEPAGGWATVVVIIEHNMDVVKTADWIIDLGRKAAKQGLGHSGGASGAHCGDARILHGAVPEQVLGRVGRRHCSRGMRKESGTHASQPSCSHSYLAHGSLPVSSLNDRRLYEVWGGAVRTQNTTPLPLVEGRRCRATHRERREAISGIINQNTRSRLTDAGMRPRWVMIAVDRAVAHLHARSFCWATKGARCVTACLVIADLPAGCQSAWPPWNGSSVSCTRHSLSHGQWQQ